ncbi:MAG: UDP-N-acetylglucosamine 2-epimerase (non-hydrolyzing), partial [Euryarchaeota archaeon]|nr:UDP-N-acetylglucosamine 2-epimerase (non-hydrolyzing) [Euryarchaeota archaeon]
MISIVLGTRPELVKMSPVIRECERREIDFQIIHSGQHYSFEMDRVFFDELGIPAPMHRLEVGSGTHAEQTGRIMIGVERALREVASGTVLVQGDTNTVLAGAVAARKLGCHVGHVEAGLRSFDRTMPEEINRVVADLVSDMLFAPTPQARENLTREGVSGTILVTGNTIVDAVQRNLELAETRSDVLEKLDLTPGGFMLATVHRQENADRRERLENIITGDRK